MYNSVKFLKIIDISKSLVFASEAELLTGKMLW